MKLTPQLTALWPAGQGPMGDDAVSAISKTWQSFDDSIQAQAWYRLGKKPVDPVTIDDIPDLLDEGRNRGDLASGVISTLGRKVRVWEEGGGTLLAAVEGTDATWQGVCMVEHAGLPISSQEALPLLAEHIRTWRPDFAAWTTTDLILTGRRAGFTSELPPFGLLSWARDGLDVTFTGGHPVALEGGTLYRFGDSLEEMTKDVADRVVNTESRS